MSAEDAGFTPAPPPPTPAAPPTVPGMLRRPTRPSTWPTAVGLISIVLGSLGALGSVWGIIQQTLIVSGALSFPSPSSGSGELDMGAIMSTGALAQLILAAASLVLAVALIVLGAKLMHRRPIARSGLLIWSIAKILAAAVATALAGWIQYKVMVPATAAITNDPSVPATARATGSAAMWGFAAFSLFLYFIWTVIWPGFLLTWLNLRAIRSEVRGWSSPTA